jgi:glycerol kinase
VTAGTATGLILALDQGGHGSRAALYEPDGTAVDAAHVPVATHRDGDHVEHDPDELLASLRQAARALLDRPAARGRSVVAAGLATQRSTIVCWERSTGRALSPAISWQDRRNAGWLERLRPSAAELRRITGLVLSPHYGAGKLRWCLDHLPEVAAAAQRDDLACGPLASWLVAGLVDGRPCVVDPANAARTLLYDPRALDWSGTLLAAFGIERRWLPRCVPTRHECGWLRIGDRRVPLTACNGDQSAAAWSSGAPDPAWALVNAGTGAFVQRAVAPGATLPDGLLLSVLDSGTAGATYSHEGTVNGAASAVSWLGERTGLDVQCALQSLSVAPDGEIPVFVNGVGGLGAPWWIASFPAEMVGDGDDLARLTAVIESVAFLLESNLAAMRRAAPVERIHISGGLARCDLLCRTLANVSGLAVERSAETEATARGIAFLAAGKPADWQPAGIERTFLPEPDAMLEARHRRWHTEMARRGAG